MGNWRSELDRHYANQLAYFGEQIVLANSAGAPLSVQVVREKRTSAEGQDPAAFEQCWTLAANLPASPARGDTATIGAAQYVVHDVKADPDSTSTRVFIYLNRRKPNA